MLKTSWTHAVFASSNFGRIRQARIIGASNSGDAADSRLVNNATYMTLHELQVNDAAHTCRNAPYQSHSAVSRVLRTRWALTTRSGVEESRTIVTDLKGLPVDV
jgi:hypothetical protein